ncbi:MAG: glycogen synthase [Chlamydiales bacterium]|nr:glycogen synthase [Chlamydiales bacterium]
MHIVHIASELAPVAKVGGLGDVLYGLSKELVSKKQKVEIIIPKYDCIDYKQLKHLKVDLQEMLCTEGSEQIRNTIWSCELENLRVLLIESHDPTHYFGREKIYGCDDDVERFTYFCRAALEYLFQTKRTPDLIHLHDWPTALIAPLYKEVYKPLGLKAQGIVLTIHNLDYQGKCLPKQISRVGLRGENPLIREKMQDPSIFGTINLLKGGIEYADQVTTVSPTYMREIMTPLAGAGLQEVVVANRNKMRGILNGIDENYWNPEKDPFLIKRYNTFNVGEQDKLQKVLEAKKENRRQLRIHFGLREGDYPIVGSVTRLVTQKGPELILHAMTRTLKRGGQFTLLGSDHGSKIEKEFLPWNGREKSIGISIDKNEALCHLIFAGSDLLIVPSLFEPCGLTQMIALRYGTVPVVRRTGGLADTVFDIDTSDRPESERNGYTFDHFDAAGMNWALDRALDCWENDRAKWNRIIMNGMRYNFSWEKSARAYLDLYTALISRDKKRAA